MENRSGAYQFKGQWRIHLPVAWGKYSVTRMAGGWRFVGVSVTIQKYLTVIDGRRQAWATELKDQIAGGGNVFVILPNAPDFLEELARVLEMEPSRLPESVNRHRFFSLSPFIDPKDFDVMMEAQEDGNLLFFIEQIDLPGVQPPRVKPFLVYCPIRGIISQHDHQSDARDACSDYVTVMSGVRTPAAAAVYKWRDNEWYNTETC